MPLKINFLVSFLCLLSLSLMASNGLETQGSQAYEFIQNKGQWNDEILFFREYNGADFYIEKTGFLIVFKDQKHIQSLLPKAHGGIDSNNQYKNKPLQYQAIRYRFLDISNNVKIYGQDSSSYYLNYILGNDPQKWTNYVRSFDKIIFENLYNGVDLQIIATGNGLKYNYIAKNKRNLKNVKLKIEGAEELKVSENEIKIKTVFETLTEQIPLTYSFSKGCYEKIKCSYSYKNNIIGLDFENWDNETICDENIVVDPELTFATYSGSRADNFGFTATYDNEGNAYGGGIISTEFIANKYPTTPGAFQTEYGGGDGSFPCDISISKYSPDGKNLLFATIIGGNKNEYPHSIVADEEQNLFILGTSESKNFPISEDAYQNNKNGGIDIFIFKLSADGTTNLASTFIGGSSNDGINDENSQTNYFYADDYRGEITIDQESKDVFIVSCTRSTDFPITQNSSQLPNGLAGLLIRFSNDLTLLKNSRFIDGNGNDATYIMDFTKGNKIVLCGGTTSTNLGGIKSAAGNSLNGNVDGFLGQFDKTTFNWEKTIYIGTPQFDQVYSLDIHKSGKIFIAGHSRGNMPVSPNAYYNPGGKQFVMQLSSDLEIIEYSTVYGSGRTIPDVTINTSMVDDCENYYVMGWGGAANEYFVTSTKNMPITSDAFQQSSDGSDFHLIVFEKYFERLKYATYIGGNRTDDHVDGGTSRFDNKGIVYQSVCASCPDQGLSGRISDFPTSDGAYSENNPSVRCSNVVFKFSFANDNTPPAMQDTLIVLTQLDSFFLNNYIIKDEDRDTLTVTITPNHPALNEYLIEYADSTIIQRTQINTALSLYTDCNTPLNDTFEIKVHAIDNGCPFFSESTKTIKIVVLPPPLPKPPEVLCLEFDDINLDRLTINWSEQEQNKYFSNIKLFKIYPDGREELLKTTLNQESGVFIDENAPDNRTQEYQYFLVPYDTCGKAGDTTYILNSVKEWNIPVTPSNVHRVTVTDDEIVEIYYEKSTEDDFKSYKIFKTKNTDDITTKTQWVQINETTDINDTVYRDPEVNADADSYCYGIVVKDDCGHQSEIANIGCNIVLQGEEKPFEFDLNWNPYKNWEKGVRNYELYRAVDTGSLRFRESFSPVQNYFTDDTLDYDWGGYFYRVKAYENSIKDSGYVSWSNSIYLIQPPLLFAPSAFSPNGDNINDLFKISHIFVKNYNLKIYNRWGEKVFETNNKKESWDAQYLKNQSPVQVFSYVLTFSGWNEKNYLKSGHITLLR